MKRRYVLYSLLLISMISSCNIINAATFNGSGSTYYDPNAYNSSSTYEEPSTTSSTSTSTSTSKPEIIHVQSISLNESTLNLNIGDTCTLIANVLPANATDKSVTWSCPTTSVISFDEGVINALSEGTLTIKAISNDGGLIASCFVSVTKPVVDIPVTGISLNIIDTNMYVNETLTLTPTISPNNATNKNITWTSSNNSLATVINGVVTALKKGEVIISVTTQDKNYKAECHINILQNSDPYLTQNNFPNTLYTVTGSSSSNTSGESPVSTFTDKRMTYVNKAIDKNNYATIVNSSGNVVRTLKKGLYYTNIDDVANYILAFNEIPCNYLEGRNASKSVAYDDYGEEYSRIAPGFYGLDYTGSSYDEIDAYPYNTLPKSTDGNYYEMDVGYTWDDDGTIYNYAGGKSYNRGPLRLIVFWEGIRKEGTSLGSSAYNDGNPVIFYTPDHYSTCYEYANYLDGWSEPLYKGRPYNYTPLTTK